MKIRLAALVSGCTSEERGVEMVDKVLRKLMVAGYQLSTLGLRKGHNLTRYYMYEHLSKYAASRPAELKVLSISRSQRLARLLGFADHQITDVGYPDVNILDLPFKEGEFDAVVSDQVLEHVGGNPQRAIDETFRVIKPGGLALHTTCFINPIHSGPNDYWRFSPDALKLLAEKHGEVIDVGGWGNPYVWILVSLGLRFVPMPHARWHPVHWVATKNVRRWPIVTWVFVKKG